MFQANVLEKIGIFYVQKLFSKIMPCMR